MEIAGLIISIGTVVGGVVIGILYLLGGLGRAERESNKDAKEATEYVIASFKEKIEILEAKVAEQAEELRKMSTRLEALISENQLLRAVLQGRDDETKRFYEQGFKAIAQTNVVLETVARTDTNISKLYTIIEKHLSNIENSVLVPTPTTVTITK